MLKIIKKVAFVLGGISILCLILSDKISTTNQEVISGISLAVLTISVFLLLYAFTQNKNKLEKTKTTTEAVPYSWLRFVLLIIFSLIVYIFLNS